MEFNELIKERRSVRKYKDTNISEAELKEIISAASLAPSWKNSQTARTYAIITGTKLSELREKILPGFNVKSSFSAALLVTCFVKDTSGFTKGEADNELGNLWGAYDLGLHDAYMVLKAKDMGYDTLIMGLRDVDAIREALSIPENEIIVSVIALGKRDEEPALRPRKDVDEVVKIF